MRAESIYAGTIDGVAGSFRPGLVRQDWTTALGAAATAFAVYVLTMAPTVTGEDAGELIAAAWTLGIPHPPGYPLFTILGKVFMTLIPIGDPAFRLNLLSGTLGACAVGMAVLLCRRLAASRKAAFAVGLIAAFTPIFWSQATMAEVYTLAAVVFLALMHAALSYLFAPTAQRLFVLAYLFGLGLTAHPSVVLAAPGLAALVVVRNWDVFRKPVELVLAALFSLLGFSIYLYLPLRSLADPAMDWGDPETLQGFLAHVLRAQYQGLGEPAANPALSGLLYLGHIALFELGLVPVILAGVGLWRLLRFPGRGNWPGERRRARIAFGAAYALWVAAYSVGWLCILTVAFDAQTVALNSVFFIPLLLLLAPAGALGIDKVGAWISARIPKARYLRPRWHHAAAVLLPVALLVVHFQSQNRQGYFIARDYAEAVLKSMPKGAIYMPSGDHATFPVLYLQLVEGQRPDVLIADKYGYVDERFLRKLGAGSDDLARLRAASRVEIDRWLIDRGGRPVFVNSKRTILELTTESFVSTGLLYRVDRERVRLSPEEHDRLWSSYRFRNLDSSWAWARGTRDMAAEFMLSEITTQRAELCFERKETEKALALLARFHELAASHKEVLQNTGSLLAERGHPKEAAGFYAQALELAPGYVQCRRNYARVLLSAGIDDAKAIAIAEASLAELPPEAAFVKALAQAYRRKGSFREARDGFLLAARVDPNDHEALRLAGEVVETDLKAPEKARPLFAESLARKPTQPDLIEKIHGKEARRRYEEEARKAIDLMLAPHLPPDPRGQGAGTAAGPDMFPMDPLSPQRIGS